MVITSKLPHLEEISKNSAHVFIPIRKLFSLQIGILSFRFAKQIRMSTSSLLVVPNLYITYQELCQTFHQQSSIV